MQIAPLHINQLRDRFFLEAAPFWWLSNASRQKELLGKFRDDDPSVDGEEKLLYSWMQLEELLATIPYGHARVILKKNVSDNVANSPTLYVKWGENSRLSGTSTATLQSKSTETMFERLLIMQQQAHEREMDMIKTLMESNFQNKVLEAEIEGMGQSSMSEELLRGGLDIVRQMVAKPQQPAALGTLGQSISEPTPTREQGAESQRPFSVDQALQDIGVIRQCMPDYHTNDVLRALALFAKEQPDQAKTYIGMLIQSLNDG